MINQGINVPDKTIAIFTDSFMHDFENKKKERLSNIIDAPPKKRDWFTSHFYRCLPLVIGNQYGFIIKSEFDFSFIWDGGDGIESIAFEIYKNNEKVNKQYPQIDSHFGSGIITISPPFWLRTPLGLI